MDGPNRLALPAWERSRDPAALADHKNKDMPDDPAILDQTRRYLLDAQRLLGQRPSPREFFDQMVAEYPDRLNPGPAGTAH